MQSFIVRNVRCTQRRKRQDKPLTFFIRACVSSVDEICPWAIPLIFGLLSLRTKTPRPALMNGPVTLKDGLYVIRVNLCISNTLRRFSCSWNLENLVSCPFWWSCVSFAWTWSRSLLYFGNVFCVRRPTHGYRDSLFITAPKFFLSPTKKLYVFSQLSSSAAGDGRNLHNLLVSIISPWLHFPPPSAPCVCPQSERREKPPGNFSVSLIPHWCADEAVSWHTENTFLLDCAVERLWQVAGARFNNSARYFAVSESSQPVRRENPSWKMTLAFSLTAS